MKEAELKLDALREKDLLVSEKDEFFKVDKALGKNILCCEQELAFRLKSVDHKNKHNLITGRLDSDGILSITGFKEHRPNI
jgi:hypothetical protein